MHDLSSHCFYFLNRSLQLVRGSFVQVVFGLGSVNFLEGLLELRKTVWCEEGLVVHQDLLGEELMGLLRLVVSLQRKLVEELVELQWFLRVQERDESKRDQGVLSHRQSLLGSALGVRQNVLNSLHNLWQERAEGVRVQELREETDSIDCVLSGVTGIWSKEESDVCKLVAELVEHHLVRRLLALTDELDEEVGCC